MEHPVAIIRSQEVRDYVDAISNLYLVGRNGMHKHNNQAPSILTAMTAVDNVIAGCRDKQNIREVNTEADYLRTSSRCLVPMLRPLEWRE